MARVLPLVLLAGWLTVTPAAGATFLYLAGERGDGVLEGGQVFLAEPAVSFDLHLRSFPAGVSFAAFPRSVTAPSWHVLMEVAEGAPLVPGTYGSAHGALVGTATYPPGNHLEVYGPAGCTGGDYGTVPSTGRFVVRHVLTFGSDIVEFAADFEQRCTGASGTLRGTIVFESGALGCFQRANGTPCDDLDPCTRDDACQGGVCGGTDAVTPTCTATGACHDAGVCDRQSGACVGVLRRDGTPCDDGSACTTGDSCQSGRCTGGPPPDCDDGSICTVERCDPAVGCVREAAPGSCWVFRAAARGTAFARGPGGSARCVLRCESPDPSVLLLGPDGSYRFQGTSTALCPSGETVSVPDEFGTTKKARRGRLLLQPANRSEILRALRDCVDLRVRPGAYREWVRPQGDRLEGRALLRGRTRVRGITVSVAVNARFTAIPALDAQGLAVPPPPRNRQLAACAPDIQARCTRD